MESKRIAVGGWATDVWVGVRAGGQADRWDGFWLTGGCVWVRNLGMGGGLAVDDGNGERVID